MLFRVVSSARSRCALGYLKNTVDMGIRRDREQRDAQSNRVSEASRLIIYFCTVKSWAFGKNAARNRKDCCH